jgi:hypothetical protein
MLVTQLVELQAIISRVYASTAARATAGRAIAAHNLPFGVATTAASTGYIALADVAP